MSKKIQRKQVLFLILKEVFRFAGILLLTNILAVVFLKPMGNFIECKFPIPKEMPLSLFMQWYMNFALNMGIMLVFVGLIEVIIFYVLSQFSKFSPKWWVYTSILLFVMTILGINDLETYVSYCRLI